MTKFPFGAILVILLAGQAVAASLEEASVAAKHGDYATAMRLLRRLAEQGNAEAEGEIGYLYQDGDGVPRNPELAMSWFRKSATDGYLLAQNKLGLMYANGWGVPQDGPQSVFWFRKAAEQGYAPAQGSLVRIYTEGRLVRQDPAQAGYWQAKLSVNPHSRVVTMTPTPTIAPAPKGP